MSESESILTPDEINTRMIMLRRPTELKRLVESIPRPSRAVPKNGLPVWSKLGLECKLPVPEMPKGRIVFSRGKIGEDVRRLGLGGPAPAFDLTDPYCYNVSYEYVPMHDPHLRNHFAQPPARGRMKQLGYVTPDNRAVCSLKDFNQFRKYLYNQFMDRIHVEMRKMDERAKDDLTLHRVDADVARRELTFTRAERAREKRERMAREHADEDAEKKRLAEEQHQKIEARIRYLIEYTERQRKERADRARERQTRIRQRVNAAAELELRRKITMLRQWRINEKRRLARLKKEKEDRQRFLEERANRQWAARVESQNKQIEQDAWLLRMYTEDMAVAANRRLKKSEKVAYETDLQLQKIRLENFKKIHGGDAKSKYLTRKLGLDFEKIMRGSKGMSKEIALEMAKEAMSSANSVKGDALMTIGQAKIKMDKQMMMATAPQKILEEVVQNAVMEFARRRTTLLLRDLEVAVRAKAHPLFFRNYIHEKRRKSSQQQRWSGKMPPEHAPVATQQPAAARASIAFGKVTTIGQGSEVEFDLKSVRDRPPTPVPSKTELLQVTFVDNMEDLPDPVSLATNLPERGKLIKTVQKAEKVLGSVTFSRVMSCLNVDTGKVTFPRLRHSMEWGEVVEAMADAIVNMRISRTSGDVRRTSEYMAYRVCYSLQAEMKELKKRLKGSFSESMEESQDFYNPDQVQKTNEH